MGQMIRYDAQRFMNKFIVRVFVVKDYRMQGTLFFIPVITLHFNLDNKVIVLNKIEQ